MKYLESFIIFISKLYQNASTKNNGKSKKIQGNDPNND